MEPILIEWLKQKNPTHAEFVQREVKIRLWAKRLDCVIFILGILAFVWSIVNPSIVKAFILLALVIILASLAQIESVLSKRRNFISWENDDTI